MSNRPDLELAVDLRSYERIVVLSGPESGQHPDSWVRLTRGDSSAIDENCVVVIDRVEVQRRTLGQIGLCFPRLLVMAPSGVEQEKSMRRLLSATYPWSEVWTVFTSFGKVLVAQNARGPAYDRDRVIDMRSPGAA